MGTNQALRDDSADYFETKFKIVTQELEKVNEKQNQCQNDKVNDSKEVCLIGSSLLREVRNNDIIKVEVKCLRGGGMDDA